MNKNDKIFYRSYSSSNSVERWIDQHFISKEEVREAIGKDSNIEVHNRGRIVMRLEFSALCNYFRTELRETLLGE